MAFGYCLIFTLALQGNCSTGLSLGITHAYEGSKKSLSKNSYKPMNNNQSGTISLFVSQLRNNIWSLGIPSFIFGIADRGIASLTDGYLSAVEVDLTLHNPYTVELSIPVYGNKRITVIFSAIPLSDTEHRLCIDIYSNLAWPRPFLQILLHFASCLTLFEDLPYLQKIAERNVERLFSSCRASNHETMLLFKRFVDLYSSRIKPSQPMKVMEATEA